MFVFKMRLALAVVVFEDLDSRPPSSLGSVISGINDSYLSAPEKLAAGQRCSRWTSSCHVLTLRGRSGGSLAAVAPEGSRRVFAGGALSLSWRSHEPWCWAHVIGLLTLVGL